MSANWSGPMQQLSEFLWEIPQSYREGMRVPGRVYADTAMLRQIREDQALEQVVNVAHLPGIVGYSLAMPDIHWGYGFPIGGVAAMRVTDGVISPGGVGYDICCGVRLLRTNLTENDVRQRIEQWADEIFQAVPSGVGTEGRIKLSAQQMRNVLTQGSAWAIAQGYGPDRDLSFTEESGTTKGADPSCVSARARERGHAQLGTLGSGNHFLEVQVIDQILDPVRARVLGLEQVGQIAIFIHSGSRGLGHQVCEDYLRTIERASSRYGIDLPDRQLASVPISSSEGQSYLAAMAAAANYAVANRQCITHWVREATARVFGTSIDSLGLELIYDVGHNIAKIEEHSFGGQTQRLCVHRKGATRAFPPGHPDVPVAYQQIGQPVLIPGDMARYSFVAVGTNRAMADSFGSTCHGAGRVQSRRAAKRARKDIDMVGALAARGIVVRARSKSTLAEEASEAYKDVTDVVRVVEGGGLSESVVRMRPIAVVKG